jgi:hypothetical protein
MEARMDSMAETRTAAGERDLSPYPVRISAVRRRSGMFTAYGWAAICGVMALTLFAAALVLH